MVEGSRKHKTYFFTFCFLNKHISLHIKEKKILRFFLSRL